MWACRFSSSGRRGWRRWGRPGRSWCSSARSPTSRPRRAASRARRGLAGSPTAGGRRWGRRGSTRRSGCTVAGTPARARCPAAARAATPRDRRAAGRRPALRRPSPLRRPRRRNARGRAKEAAARARGQWAHSRVLGRQLHCRPACPARRGSSCATLPAAELRSTVLPAADERNRAHGTHAAAGLAEGAVGRARGEVVVDRVERADLHALAAADAPRGHLPLGQPQQIGHENTAPVGQTYLHQNRGRSTPSSKNAKEQADRHVVPRADRRHLVPAAHRAGLSGASRNAMPRVTTGIAATKPVISTPRSELTSAANSR